METTRNDLLYGELSILQPVDGPRVNLDTILLTAFSKLKRGDKVIEFGSAHGAVSLILGLRFPLCGSIVGLDVQPELVDLARQNSLYNKMDHLVDFHVGDIRKIRESYSDQSFDVVVTNPPYDEPGQGRPRRSQCDAIARQGLLCSLDDVVASAHYLLKNRGHLYMVFRATRLGELLALLCNYNLEPKRLRSVHPRPGKSASVVLVQATRAAGKGMVVEPPLYVLGEDGHYTPEVLSFYGKEEGRCLS